MGVGSGYAQADVEALARILTGVGIDLKPEDPKLKPDLQSQLVREGAFEFNPARHDYGDKTFLGYVIKDRGLAEVDEALDILCRHPATATHLSRQLATISARTIRPRRWCSGWRRPSRRPTATSPLSLPPWSTRRNSPTR